MFGLGLSPVGMVTLVLLGVLVARTVNTFAMAAMLFTPAFLGGFPRLVPGYTTVGSLRRTGLSVRRLDGHLPQQPARRVDGAEDADDGVLPGRVLVLYWTAVMAAAEH